MEKVKKSLDVNNIKNYINLVKEYSSIVNKRETDGSDLWKGVKETKVEAINLKANVLSKLEDVHKIFIDHLENGNDTEFNALVSEAYDGILGMIDGSKRDLFDKDALFINSSFQPKIIAFWKKFKFSQDLDLTELRGTPFITNWNDEFSVDFSAGQLFLVKHISHFRFNVLKYEELKRAGSEITPEEFTNFLLPVFFLPVGCLDFMKDANACSSGLISLNYANKTVVNV